MYVVFSGPTRTLKGTPIRLARTGGGGEDGIAIVPSQDLEAHVKLLEELGMTDIVQYTSYSSATVDLWRRQGKLARRHLPADG